MSPDSLRTAIQALHEAIAEHQDPAAKATLAKCLQQMLQVQAQDHQQAEQGPGGGGDPRQAIMQMMGGGAGGP